MCLFVKDRKLNFKNGRIVLYKAVYLNNGLISIYQDYEYKPGWNLPNKSIVDRYYSGWYDRDIIEGGVIHVCTSKKQCSEHTLGSNSLRVIPVVCYKKDLIATGEDSEAAFSKIYIRKKDYQKALKSKTIWELFRK